MLRKTITTPIERSLSPLSWSTGAANSHEKTVHLTDCKIALTRQAIRNSVTNKTTWRSNLGRNGNMLHTQHGSDCTNTGVKLCSTPACKHSWRVLASMPFSATRVGCLDRRKSSFYNSMHASSCTRCRHRWCHCGMENIHSLSVITAQAMRRFNCGNSENESRHCWAQSS